MVAGSAGVGGKGGSIGTLLGGGRRRDSHVSRSVFSLYEYVVSNVEYVHGVTPAGHTELFVVQDPVSWSDLRGFWGLVLGTKAAVMTRSIAILASCFDDLEFDIAYPAKPV